TPGGYVHTTYTLAEVDLFGVYCGALDRCFLLPAARCVGMRQIMLRLSPARNGQQACTNLADDFTFDGAVAQLARAPRWQRGGQCGASDGDTGGLAVRRAGLPGAPQAPASEPAHRASLVRYGPQTS